MQVPNAVNAKINRFGFWAPFSNNNEAMNPARILAKERK
jgi:hypothetical protein